MSDVNNPDGEVEPEFQSLLEYIHRSRGFDFSGYKRASLKRRIKKRMQMVTIADYGSYQDYLEVHPEEFRVLFDTILINVTAFFRDPAAWEVLGREIVPRLVAARPPDEPIRLWSAGCASGEEAYSLAIMMAEALGMDEMRARVKIYATDADEGALTKARQATFEAKELQGLSHALLEKYLEPVGHRYVLNKDLRRVVIFGRHDLIQDAPISKIDLLTCRNTLMYFNTETQARILERFHFALMEHGFLFLGKAETLLAYNQSFIPVDLKHRIFTKAPKGNLHDRLLALARTGSEEAANPLSSQFRIREAAFDAGPFAQLVIDLDGLLFMANERAREIFGLTLFDLGRPLKDLQISYRPVELRSCLERAYQERRTVLLNEVEWRPGGGETMHLDVTVVPLLDATGALLGASVSFLDVTAARRLKEELMTSTHELETAYEELQSTNEELETTNEELQSTNEELEAMNEELQSTNEEIETINGELRQRSEDLNRVNVYLESILASLRGGVVVVDRDLQIQIWSAKCEDLWGLRAEEVKGKNLLNLDIGLPLLDMKQPIRTCLSGDGAYQEITMPATNRRGKSIQCRVTCTRMTDEIEPRGVVLVMEEDDGARMVPPATS
jgi:two-component system CheB/CheR fusion protein